MSEQPAAHLAEVDRIRGLTPRELEEAQVLARTKVAVNKRLGRPTEAWIQELARGENPWSSGSSAAASQA